MARSQAGQAVWRQQVHDRRAAMALVKHALDGRPQTWLREQLRRPPLRITVQSPLLNAYLNGYARVPETVLWAMCKIVGGVEMDDVLARVADRALLLQPKPTRKRSRAQKRQAASA